jgi:hypothetical protein
MKRYINKDHEARIEKIDQLLEQVNDLLEGTDVSFDDLYLVYIDHKKSNKVVGNGSLPPPLLQLTTV